MDNIRNMSCFSQKDLQKILSLNCQTSRIIARVDAELRELEKFLVDDEIHIVVLVKKQSHRADRAAVALEKLKKLLVLAEGKASLAYRLGNILCLERLVLNHEKQEKLCFLTVAQKEILAERRAELFANTLAVLHCCRRRMLGTPVWNAQLI